MTKRGKLLNQVEFHQVLVETQAAALLETLTVQIFQIYLVPIMIFFQPFSEVVLGHVVGLIYKPKPLFHLKIPSKALN